MNRTSTIRWTSIFPSLLLGAVVSLHLASCANSAHKYAPPPGDNGGDASVAGGNTDLGAGPGGTDGPTSVDPGNPDSPCAEQKFLPMKVGDPDIILVQDTSGSMADSPMGQAQSKYDIVVTAENTAITQLQQMMSPIEWGLVVFPSDNDCGVSNTLEVPVGMNNAAAIINAIKAKQPGGNTPTYKGIDTAVAYYDTLKDGRGHYIALATDGEPNCDGGGANPGFCTKDADCPMGQKCLVIGPLGVCMGGAGGNAGMAGASISNALKKGVKTFVIGIDTGGDAATLDQMATLGGTARANAPKYYPVSDVTALESALSTITAQIISCTFALQNLPMNNQDISVSVNGNPVLQDTKHANGWDVDPMTKTLTFYGPACTSLQANPGAVAVDYTCPPPS
jgi:hypothetical protein